MILVLLFFPLLIFITRFLYRSRKLSLVLLPEVLVFLPFFFGTFLKGLWLFGYIPGDDILRAGIKFGLSDDDLIIGLLLYNLGILSFIIGTLFRIPLVKFFARSPKKYRGNRILYFLFIVSFILGLFALNEILKHLELNTYVLSELSGKKKIITDSGVRLSFGYYRIIGRLINYATVLVFVKMQLGERRNRALQILFFIGLSSSLLSGFIYSDRMEILNLFSVLIILKTITDKLPVRLIVIGSVFLFFIQSLILNIRTSNFRYAQEVTPIEALIANHNMLGFVKLSLVVDKMNSISHYKFGSTYMNWIFAPIPRSLWIEKPPVSTGLVMRKEIMPLPNGDLSSGIPPSFFTESFWNFGFIGLLVLPFVWGGYLNSLAKHLSTRVRGEDFISELILPVYLIWNFGFRLASEDLSYIMVSTLEIMLIYKIFSKIIFKKPTVYHEGI